MRRDRIAAAFDDYAFLKARVSSALIERLDDTTRTFEAGLELGAAGGDLSAALLTSGKAGRMLTGDVSAAMTAKAAARGLEAQVIDDEALQLEEAQFDLVVSGLNLHWVNDLPGALVQIRRVLKPDGLFVGALFGAGTLAELREVLIAAESEITGSLAARLSPLPALADMAHLMQRAGFALPVVDRDTVRVRYGTLMRLFADLKGMGERAAFAGGHGRPLRRDVLARAAALYAERYQDADSKLTAQFEIVYLSGWCPAPSQPQPLKPGSATHSLKDALRDHGRKRENKLPD